jgi:hypothetical protein
MGTGVRDIRDRTELSTDVGPLLHLGASLIVHIYCSRECFTSESIPQLTNAAPFVISSPAGLAAAAGGDAVPQHHTLRSRNVAPPHSSIEVAEAVG